MNMQRLAFLFLALVLGTLPAHAAQLSIEAPLAGAQTEFLLPVVFNPQSDAINVVEGTIAIPEGIEIDSIDTSGSAFPLFADGPAYMLSSRSIVFTAGAPGGLAPNSVALLFIIHAHAGVPGTYALTPKHMAAYGNDGKGTETFVTALPASVVVGAKGSANVDAFPPSAPQKITAEVGKDDSLFNGKWFITFYGGASGASVDHYEVQESWWRPSVRADRYYVLRDQDLRSTIWVKAVSGNGKSVTEAIPAAHPWVERAMLAGIGMLVVVLAFALWKRMRRSY